MNNYAELVKRLREHAQNGWLIMTKPGDTMIEAANAIERLLAHEAAGGISEAAQTLLDFIGHCPGDDSWIKTPDGQTLRTDWGYVCDGLRELYRLDEEGGGGMSGIYIPGMKMPKSCGECLDVGWHYVFECNLDDMEDGERRADCPLIAVPDHGKLVDADALIRELAPTEEDRHTGAYLVHAVFLQILKDAPTIFPADKEDGE